MKIAHVSTFPALQCGIAFYANDLIESLPQFDHRKYSLHYGANLTPDAIEHADVASTTSLYHLARSISRSDCDVVSLQHEFGIWGGPNGEHLNAFLEGLTKPIVSTLHTTFTPGARPPIQMSLLRALVTRSAQCVVLTEESRQGLLSALHDTAVPIKVIPHGVPMLPYMQPPPISSSSSVGAPRWKLCSIGFFRPDKGLERVLQALKIIKEDGYSFEYIHAGQAQPQFSAQKSYAVFIRQLATELGLSEIVRFEMRFLSRNEQIDLIRSSHAGIFAYQDAGHASSGTVPLLMTAGRPVICTPFEYALAKARETNGVIVTKDFTPLAIADGLRTFFDLGEAYTAVTDEVRARAQHWSWDRVATEYASIFSEAYHELR